jgi:hypothetical protein
VSARGEEIMRLVPTLALSQSDIAPLRAAVEALVADNTKLREAMDFTGEAAPI